MADDRYEPNRFLGFPVRTGPERTGPERTSPERTGPRANRHEESQRVMGFPVDWFGSDGRDQARPLAHPIRGYKRWLRRRRLGPYAVDEDQGH
jgi:hypothetical protein